MQWFPIETLPQDGTHVLIAGRMSERHGGYWLYDDIRCFDGMYMSSTFAERREAQIMKPTYWAYFNLPDEPEHSK